MREGIFEKLKELEFRGRPLIVDENDTIWEDSTQDKLLDCLIEIACDYIEWGRHRRDGKVMSRLERRFMFTVDFYTCENPEEWLEAHREPNDHNLIMFVLERHEEMESPSHRQKISHIIDAIFS